MDVWFQVLYLTYFFTFATANFDNLVSYYYTFQMLKDNEIVVIPLNNQHVCLYNYFELEPKNVFYF